MYVLLWDPRLVLAGRVWTILRGQHPASFSLGLSPWRLNEGDPRGKETGESGIKSWRRSGAKTLRLQTASRQNGRRGDQGRLGRQTRTQERSRPSFLVGLSPGRAEGSGRSAKVNTICFTLQGKLREGFGEREWFGSGISSNSSGTWRTAVWKRVYIFCDAWCGRRGTSTQLEAVRAAAGSVRKARLWPFIWVPVPWATTGATSAGWAWTPPPSEGCKFLQGRHHVLVTFVTSGS